MKFEEGTLTNKMKETLKEILEELGESDFREFTQNVLPVKFDDENDHLESKKLLVQFRNVENIVFSKMRYKLYDVHGKTLLAKKVNQMSWPTSMRWVSVPSAVVPISYDNEKTQLPNASLSFRARAATSKMHVSRFSATNRISTASAIMRSSGSTWMTRAPKSSEKSFSNYNHFVFDEYLMKLDGGNATEKILMENKEFRKIIRKSSRQNGKGQKKKVSDKAIQATKQDKSFVHCDEKVKKMNEELDILNMLTNRTEEIKPVEETVECALPNVDTDLQASDKTKNIHRESSEGNQLHEATHKDKSDEKDRTVAVRVDKSSGIDDGSLFGILRVYCSSS